MHSSKYIYSLVTKCEIGITENNSVTSIISLLRFRSIHVVHVKLIECNIRFSDIIPNPVFVNSDASGTWQFWTDPSECLRGGVTLLTSRGGSRSVHQHERRPRNLMLYPHTLGIFHSTLLSLQVPRFIITCFVMFNFLRITFGKFQRSHCISWVHVASNSGGYMLLVIKNILTNNVIKKYCDSQ